MAYKFWVEVPNNRKDWDTQNESTNWSDSSGGSPGAVMPGINDDVILDENSGTGLSMISNNIEIKSLNCEMYKGELRIAANIKYTISSALRLNEEMKYTADDFAAIVVFYGEARNLYAATKEIQSFDVSKIKEIISRAIISYDKNIEIVKKIEITTLIEYINYSLINAGITMYPLFKTEEELKAWVAGIENDPIEWVNSKELLNEDVINKIRAITQEVINNYNINGKQTIEEYMKSIFINRGIEIIPIFENYEDLYAWAYGKRVESIAWVNINDFIIKEAVIKEIINEKR